jgi:hypothetical protein
MCVCLFCRFEFLVELADIGVPAPLQIVQDYIGQSSASYILTVVSQVAKK